MKASTKWLLGLGAGVGLLAVASGSGKKQDVSVLAPPGRGPEYDLKQPDEFSDSTHSHTLDGGERLTWRVDRLHDAAVGLVPFAREVSSFSSDMRGVVWIGRGERPTIGWVVQHCRRILDADLSYPIILARDGRIMDGAHRLARCVLEEIPIILCVQFETDPEPDLRRQPDDRSGG